MAWLVLVGCGGETVTFDSGETLWTHDSGTADSGTHGCDDPFPALCVTGETLEGDPQLPRRVEVLEGETLVDAYDCGPYDCCTWTPPTGTYTVAALLGEERLVQTADVVNSNGCDHEVTTVHFVFDLAR